MVSSSYSFAPGTQLGKYEIIRSLAMGGMAELFLARARGIEGFQKVVVLKRILPQYAEDENFVTMFLDEARLAATLQHPNIAQVYDIGVVDDSYFFTMEYVQGPSLLEILKKEDWSQKGLPLEAALAIGVGLVAGLQYAHDKTDDDGNPLGIVHRDVSPANVMVTYDGFVKLVDFGIAKAASQQAVTQSSTLKGKLRYMSPEQVAAIPLDRRSDLFAVGVLLYEMTSGFRLIDAENALAVVRKIADGDFDPPSARRSDYPADLEEIVMRALHVDRDQRYASARDMQLELEAFALSQRISLSPLQLAEYVGKLVGKMPRQPSAPTVADAPLAASLPSTPVVSAPPRSRIAPPATVVLEAQQTPVAALGAQPTPVAVLSAQPTPVAAPQPGAKRGTWFAAAVVVAIVVAGLLAILRLSRETEPAGNQIIVVPINPTPPPEERVGEGADEVESTTSDDIAVDEAPTDTGDEPVLDDAAESADEQAQARRARRERRKRKTREKREAIDKAKARDKKDKSKKIDLDSPFLPGGS